MTRFKFASASNLGERADGGLEQRSRTQEVFYRRVERSLVKDDQEQEP